MIQEPKVCIRRSYTPAGRVLPPDAFCFCGVLPRGKHSERERKMCHGDYAKKQQPLRDRTPFQAIAPLFHSHNADPDGQLPLQHRGSDLCGTGRGDHRHGGGQRGLSGVHSGQCRLAAAGGRLRRQRQSVSGAQGAGNGKPHLRSCRYLDHHQRHCSGTGLWHFHAADRKAFRFYRHRLRGSGGLSAGHRMGDPVPAHLPRLHRHDTGRRCAAVYHEMYDDRRCHQPDPRPCVHLRAEHGRCGRRYRHCDRRNCRRCAVFALSAQASDHSSYKSGTTPHMAADPAYPEAGLPQSADPESDRAGADRSE